MSQLRRFAPLTKAMYWVVRQKLLPPVVQLGGRISGIVTALVVVQQVGLSVSAQPLFLALAVFTTASSAIAGTVEPQAMVEIGQRRGIGLRSVVWAGAAAGTLIALAAGALGAALLAVPGFGGVGTFLPFLLLALPVQSLGTALFAQTIIEGKWWRGALPATLRTVLVASNLPWVLGVFGLRGVPVVIFSAEIIRTSLLATGTRRSGAVNRQEVSTITKAILQQVPSTAMTSLNPLVDRTVIASLALGNLLVLEVAERVSNVPLMLFSYGILPLALRRWTLQAPSATRAGDIILYARRASWVSGAATLGVAALLVAWPHDEHGVLLVTATYLLGIGPCIGNQVLTRLLILTKQFRVLTVLAISQLVVNVALDVALGSLFGIAGIGLATSCRMAASYFILRRILTATYLKESTGVPAGIGPKPR
jgi:hypothetical protein